jgi:two-component system response regulator MprA
MLPGYDGVEVLRRLRADEGDGARVPVLLLTARDDVGDRVRGLDAGADDYLVKPFAIEELTARLRALRRRRVSEASDPDRSLRFADLVVDTASREVRRDGRLLQLTTKEYELLTFLMRNARVVLSRERLLAAVWGIDFDAHTHVLEVYVGYLRAKLEKPGVGVAPAAGPLPRLIHTVRGVGYVMREP